MACFHPLKGWRSKSAGPNGKRPIVFNKKEGFSDLPITLPCGQCTGCRLEKSRQWAIRCSHEASLYEENSFITLTYDDANLPPTGSLKPQHFTKFMKRLRKQTGCKIRYYHCGEYGENFGRPHYHAAIFNYDFPDKIHYKTTKNGDRLYTSQILSKIWPAGLHTTGDVTFKSAAYIARYIMKKINGEAADAHYEIMNSETGELSHLIPEYSTMSRRPGIGQGWVEKYHGDVYPDDFVIINGKKSRAPRYYDQQFEIAYPADFAKTRAERVRSARKHEDNNTPDRLKVREKVQNSKISQLKRGQQ